MFRLSDTLELMNDWSSHLFHDWINLFQSVGMTWDKHVGHHAHMTGWFEDVFFGTSAGNITGS